MCYIHFENESVIMGTLVNGLYILEMQESMRDRNVNVIATSKGKHS